MRIFVTRKNQIIVGKFKRKHFHSVPLNYLLWVQNNLYHKMGNHEKRMIDEQINYLIEKDIHNKTKDELSWIKKMDGL